MPRLRSILMGALVGAGALVLPAALRAQSDAIVTITPMYGEWTGTEPTHVVDVTITWCSPDGMLGALVTTLDGQAISLHFKPGVVPNCSDYGESRGQVTLTPGTHQLRAENWESGSVSGYAASTYTYTQPAAGVRVTPQVDGVQGPAGSGQVARFRVVNTGEIQSSYTLSTPCSGVGTCTASDSIVELAVKDSAFVDVSYTTPPGGTGQVKLRADAGTATSTGTVQVTALTPPEPGYPGDSLSLMGTERGACITIALGPGAASECGDLRVVHGLPAVRELNRARAPLLIYNSQHAQPHPVVAMEVTPPAGTAPDSIGAVLSVEGLAQTKRSWPAWTDGTPRVVAVAPDAIGLNTGVYAYTMEVSAHWNSGTSTAFPTRMGHLVVVNRGGSPFGKGWWLSGLEQIYFSGDTVRLWVGGDGSTRLYRRPPGASGLWFADQFVRADTLRMVGTEYVRTLPGGAKVYFSSSGEHLRTVNPLGQATVFGWSLGTTGRLTRIDLPATTDMPAPAHYLFEYDNNTSTAYPRLSRVRAPWLTGYRDVGVTTDSWARVTAITDPYLGAAPPDTIAMVQFGYGGNWMTSRTDRRGAVQEFAYNLRRLRTARRFPAAGDTVLLSITPAENRGISGPRAAGSAHANFTGPRGSVNGVAEMLFWQVDRWGAPTIAAAPGSTGGWNETHIERGDPRWPGRVTKVVAPNGFTTTAAFEGRGNLASQTQWYPYGDTRNATTTYAWDARWDAVTRVTLPEGEVSIIHYDDYGRRRWEQAGPDSARGVAYGYFPLTHARAPGQLEKVTMPGGAIERYEYDVRGNLSATESPMGARSEFVSDRLGRVTLSRTVIDTVQGVLRFQGDSTTHFDLRDRPLRAVSFGPAMNEVGAEAVVVVNQYDREGNLLSVSRQSRPDTAHIGAVATRFQYDLVGRQVAEIAPDMQKDTTFYDRGGNVVGVRTRRYQESLGDPVTTDLVMEYDVNGRLKRRRTPSVHYAPRSEGIGSGVHRKHQSYPYYPNQTDRSHIFPAEEERFVYDDDGNLIEADNRHAWVRRTYFPNGQLNTDVLKVRTVAELNAGGDSTTHVYVLQQAYDRNGRRTQLTNPQQLAPRVGGVVQDRTSFGYHRETGALERVTDPLGNVFTYQYNARGEQVELVLPGGISNTFGYDLDARATAHRIANGSTAALRYAGSTLRQDTVRYDARGKMVFYGNTAGNRDTASISYSGLGQLVQSTHRYRGYLLDTDQNAQYVANEVPRHDALGNVLSMYRTGTTEVYQGTWLDAGSSNTSWSNTSWLYEGGTGRLLRRMSPTDKDTTVYDAGGNAVFSMQKALTVSGTNHDRAMFYDAAGRLRIAETRRVENAGARANEYYMTFDEYRYDALGRRVWVMTRKNCERTTAQAACAVGFLTRTVWDGDRELYEIRVPVSSDNTLVNIFFSAAEMESDTAYVRNLGRWDGFDPNPMYGRIAYTYGHAIDMPLSVIRMNYADHPYGLSYHRWSAPFAIVPHWNLRGQAQTGTYANDGARWRCITLSGETQRCVALDWPSGWFPYNPARPVPEHWHGTLLGDKRDGSGLLYRRNRYYDPASARFTQEDPIGLAGGMNVYGFAAGDPVNYSDPYGLCPDDPKKPCPRVWALGLNLAATFGLGATIGGGVMWNDGPGAYLTFGLTAGAGASMSLEASTSTSLQSFEGWSSGVCAGAGAGVGGTGCASVAHAEPMWETPGTTISGGIAVGTIVEARTETTNTKTISWNSVKQVLSDYIREGERRIINLGRPY